MRTSFHLFSLLVQALLVRSDLSQTRICALESPIAPPGSAICLPDPGYPTCQDGNCSSPSQHIWTHTTPCDQGEYAEQPICVFTDTAFAGGRGISLVTTPERAAFLATIPPFTDPATTHGINQAPNTTSPKYEMSQIPGKGMGLVATAPILRGELLLANTPSLIIDYRAFSELSKPNYTALQAAAVSHLPTTHQSTILALSAHIEDTSHLTPAQLIDAIAATNSFDIEPHPDDELDQHNSFFVLFPDIARMNHDCRPNTDFAFDYGTLSQSIHATRDISPGEELTLSYINPLMTHSQRTTKLKRNWGFNCSCPLCKLSNSNSARGAESDSRINTILKMRDELRDWTEGRSSRACPEMAELLVSLYEMERLWGLMHEAYALAALEWNAAGEPWTAVKFARLAVEWGIPHLGEGDGDIRELRKLAEDPWGHWSWEKRVRGGTQGVGEKTGVMDDS